MASFRVYVTGDNANDVPVGSWFTIEAADDVDAANEAVMAARDCGWTNTHTTRVILSDYRPTASDRIRAAREARGSSDPLNRLRAHNADAIAAGAEPITEQRPPVIATCGYCGLSWNDAEPTSWTPAPSGRCPFEYDHHEDGSPTDPDEIPADFPVRPIVDEQPAPDVLELRALRRVEARDELADSPLEDLKQARRAASRRFQTSKEIHGKRSPHTIAARAAHNAIAGEIQRRQNDEHSGSRRLEVLEQDAPHLIAAPDVVADLHRYAHELADAAINGAAGGYAETDEESDRRAALRDDLEGRLYSIARLETIRGEIRAERVSYGDLAELQSLAAHIEPDDVELLEAAGIPEHDDDATE